MSKTPAQKAQLSPPLVLPMTLDQEIQAGNLPDEANGKYNWKLIDGKYVLQLLDKAGIPTVVMPVKTTEEDMPQYKQGR